nr:hypothetical protein [Actinomycetota bacterium]
MRSRAAVRVLLTVAAATTLVAGACGGGGPSPQEIVLAASSETVEAKSSRVAFSMRMTGVEGIETGEITVDGEGAMDYSKGVGTFSMTLPPIGGVELGRIDAVLIGTVMYQRF